MAGSKGMGLNIMRYRAGMIGAELKIGPGRNRGTEVRCRFRFKKDKERK
jgi:nitrate/nitrite-specific signal transduction histidine kinase